ncbi:MAG: thioesterase family protein [Gracilibacteraceae bacterium]|nr:thioesterase family protein [Gracilibacteraceae bacterium]
MKVGISATIHTTVDKGNTACTVGSGGLDVFATPAMSALMERADCEALTDMLEPGQTSVGANISVSHAAASPIGVNVAATATITAVDGRKIEFAVTACDGAGEIGNGTHTRFIVDAEKFMSKASTRK